MTQESRALVGVAGDQSVREKVRAALLDAIPESAWDGLIQAELKAYFEPSEKVDYSTNRINTVVSPFTKLVHTIAEEVIREATMKAIKEYQSTTWDHDLQAQVNKQLGETLVRIAPELIAAIMRDSAQRFVQGMGYR